MSDFAFLITPFSTKLLNFFKSTGTVLYLTTSKSSIFVFKLFELVRTSTSSLMCSLLTLGFKSIK